MQRSFPFSFRKFISFSHFIRTLVTLCVRSKTYIRNNLYFMREIRHAEDKKNYGPAKPTFGILFLLIWLNFAVRVRNEFAKRNFKIIEWIMILIVLWAARCPSLYPTTHTRTQFRQASREMENTSTLVTLLCTKLNLYDLNNVYSTAARFMAWKSHKRNRAREPSL